MPGSIRRHPQAPNANANVVQARPGRQGRTGVNVVEVTPGGAVIAHVEPKGGGGGSVGGFRGGHAHGYISPTSEDESYTSSSEASVAGMHRGPPVWFPGFRPGRGSESAEVGRRAVSSLGGVE